MRPRAAVRRCRLPSSDAFGSVERGAGVVRGGAGVYGWHVISSSRPLLLGSASPRRRDILASLGLPFVVLAADIVEDVVPGETPHAYLERIAAAKLDAIYEAARPRFMALREVPAEERGKARERITADIRAQIGDILTPAQKQRYAAIVAESGGRQTTRGRIYLLGEDGKPRAYNVRLGISDGTMTELPEGGGEFLPKGWGGALAALPFAVWLFLAIEQLPLAAEETHDPKEHMPKGIILGMSTLVVSAFLTMFLNSGVGGTAEGQMHGAFSLGTSAEPLLDGFRVTIGGNIAKLLALLAVVGLIASFHTIIYAYGRQIYSLSRAGYFPQTLSVTHGAHKTPNRALIAGTVLGFAVMMVVWFVAGAEKGGALIGGTLLNLAVFGAMLSYALQGLSFILLRVKMPHIARPYHSPLGNFGAAVTIVIALVTLYYQVHDPVYRNGVIGAAIWYVLGILYFAAVGRHKLVLSPEEEFALTKGAHGHPETEGYGKTTL